MRDRSTPFGDEPAADPALLRTLAAAGLPTTGRFLQRAGWVSRVWVGGEYVVRLSNGQFRDASRHEAKVVALLARSEVPHARHIAHGDGPDGPWCVYERVPGRTLYEAWPAADQHTRQAMIESFGLALRALHRVPVTADLLPPRSPASRGLRSIRRWWVRRCSRSRLSGDCRVMIGACSRTSPIGSAND